jgi:hypothetical protein
VLEANATPLIHPSVAVNFAGNAFALPRVSLRRRGNCCWHRTITSRGNPRAITRK